MSICIGIRAFARVAWNLDPYSLVVRVLLNAVDLNRFGIEVETVRFGGHLADLAD